MLSVFIADVCEAKVGAALWPGSRATGDGAVLTCHLCPHVTREGDPDFTEIHHCALLSPAYGNLRIRNIIDRPVSSRPAQEVPEPGSFGCHPQKCHSPLRERDSCWPHRLLVPPLSSSDRTNSIDSRRLLQGTLQRRQVQATHRETFKKSGFESQSRHFELLTPSLGIASIED